MIDEAKQIKAFIKQKIMGLSGNNNDSAVRAILANLRRGVGKKPGSIPILWSIILDGLPGELTGKEIEPTYGEWAAYTTLTLFALHQQGKDILTQCMSKEEETLGLALRKLVQSEDEEKRVKRRFDAAATAESLEELSHHLRGLIQLLKAKDIPLDYPALASDLFYFQFSDVRDTVRLRWGHDFYRLSRNEQTSQKNQ
jgi:CRISPR system Cascade subunit CasB